MKDIIINSALWAAYGDSLGFITEFASPSLVAQRVNNAHVSKLTSWQKRVGGKYGVDVTLPSGCYSDDTQLRLATSRSIRSNGEFDVEMFSKVELPVWLSYSLGAGLGSKAASENIKKEGVAWNNNFYETAQSIYINAGGNGAAMRIQPHVWAASLSDLDEVVLRNVIRNTIVTHGHPRAIVGACFYALLLRKTIHKKQIHGVDTWLQIFKQLEEIPGIVRRDSELTLFWLPHWEQLTKKIFQKEIIETINECIKDVSFCEELLNKYSKQDVYPKAVRQLGCLDKVTFGSATKTTILAALASWIYADNPYEGLVSICNVLGSDTDTIGTMAGAILGVVANTKPPETPCDYEYIISEAERMCDISCKKSTQNTAYPDLLYWRAPKTQSDALGVINNIVVLKGLGQGDFIGEPYKEKGKYDFSRQWFKLYFGQTILIKMREKLPAFESNDLPKGNQRTVQSTQQSLLWDYSKNIRTQTDGTVAKAMDINTATDIVIRSQFKAEIIGKFFLEIAKQDKGIEKAIAFSSIVAKALIVRQNR